VKKQEGVLMRIMEGIFLGTKDQVSLERALSLGITHIVAAPDSLSLELKDKF